jgi:hypothetical protein
MTDNKVKEEAVETTENDVKEIVKDVEKAKEDSEKKSEEILEQKEKIIDMAKAETSSKNTNHDDIFITEKNTFDITIKYYVSDGQLFVKNISEYFDDENENMKEFTVTLKHPSQKDYETLLATSTYDNKTEFSFVDIVKLEISRLVILIRSWSIDKSITDLYQLNPKIIKAMTVEIRNVIEMDGII